MKNDLITNQNIKTLDSREVAEMVGIKHSNLLRMLDGDETHIGIIPVLRKTQLELSKFL